MENMALKAGANELSSILERATEGSLAWSLLSLLNLDYSFIVGIITFLMLVKVTFEDTSAPVGVVTFEHFVRAVVDIFTYFSSLYLSKLLLNALDLGEANLDFAWTASYLIWTVSATLHIFHMINILSTFRGIGNIAFFMYMSIFDIIKILNDFQEGIENVEQESES